MRYILPFIILILPVVALSSPAEEPKEFRIPFLDSAQQFFGAHANFAANRLDSFFATERADDEFGRSSIRIRSQYTIKEREVGDLDNQYRFNLRLPHLEQKFQYDFDKDDKPKSKDEVEDLMRGNRINRSWIFNADMGVTAAIPPRLTTRARVRRNFTTQKFIHRFVEQLTYITNESGFTEETQLESDYPFDEDVLFRFVNNKTWGITEKDFSTRHGPTLLHRVSDDDAFNYGVTLSSIIDEGVWFVNNYRLSIDYRRNLYRQWIYLDVIPGIDFPKEWSFRRTPFIIFQIELLFGGK